MGEKLGVNNICVPSQEQDVQYYCTFENKPRNRKKISPDVKNYCRGTSMGENLGNTDLQYSLLLLCNA